MEQVIGMWAAQFRNTCRSPKTELEIPTATLMLSICSSSPSPCSLNTLPIRFFCFRAARISAERAASGERPW
jgi:hypothetical protein